MDLQAKLAELTDLQRQRDDIDQRMMALFKEDKPAGTKRGRPPKPPASPPTQKETPAK